MGRERLEMTDLRERRGRDFAEEEVRARSPLALPELEWESVPARLVLKIVFISLEALESPEADLFTGFIGLIPGCRSFRRNQLPESDWTVSSIRRANPIWHLHALRCLNNSFELPFSETSSVILALFVPDSVFTLTRIPHQDQNRPHYKGQALSDKGQALSDKGQAPNSRAY